ncbi:hypothetical protein HLB23_30400 [Nocardia uniformis]|uniref:Uncharacterized protein n=1 Tax=Nocardia uniformis TaxID=53432 RepID=A0A849CCM5_9NOCA|nr:hypothetical protein [Nocardia uniformis]NNH74115.1 hypothetical protein [Nocardia uniformis]
MGQRRIVAGFGLAALAAGAVTVAAPQAFAQELAPGVSCEEFGFECSNDTDDTYRVKSTVGCGGSGVATTWHDVTTYVPPRARVTVSTTCSPRHESGSWEHQPPKLGPDGKYESQPPVWEPGDVVPTRPTGVIHQSAVVDNNPPAPAPSGSFG